MAQSRNTAVQRDQILATSAKTSNKSALRSLWVPSESMLHQLDEGRARLLAPPGRCRAAARAARTMMAPHTASFRPPPGCSPPKSGPQVPQVGALARGRQRDPGRAAGRPRPRSQCDSTTSRRLPPPPCAIRFPRLCVIPRGATVPRRFLSTGLATGPHQHSSRTPRLAHVCRSPEPRRPWTLAGPAWHNSVPPKGAGAQDHGNPGCCSASAHLPYGRRRPQSHWMPPDKPGRTQSSPSSRPPSLPAWPRTPCSKHYTCCTKHIWAEVLSTFR
ncbi:hypothetical protein NDU88_004823 [Pleurodeles waltl]|uniref:Uncharacterized protein n=1 Tax=Pleurodeles waltl TaxID=8319 RepID=A0AAV7SJX0_PLEWA|nr:hypothetical protein NDU88_004823 [Pleurodeles waltl]